MIMNSSEYHRNTILTTVYKFSIEWVPSQEGGLHIIIKQ